MKNESRFLLCGWLVAFIFATALPASAKADTGTLIIPGKSIGTLSLGLIKSDGNYNGNKSDETTYAAMGGNTAYGGISEHDQGRKVARSIDPKGSERCGRSRSFVFSHSVAASVSSSDCRSW